MQGYVFGAADLLSSDNGRCSENCSRPITTSMPVVCLDQQRPLALSVAHHSLGMLLVE